MSSTEIIPFTFEEVNVRTVLVDGEPWWVLDDVAKALAIANAHDLVNRLDDDEKGVGQINTLGGRQSLTTVNEAGLFSVILRSDKVEAKRFKRWVTHRVATHDATCACEMTQPSVSPSARAIASISPSVAGGVSRLRMMPRRLADMPARAAIALRPIPERVAASSSTSATA